MKSEWVAGGCVGFEDCMVALSFAFWSSAMLGRPSSSWLVLLARVDHRSVVYLSPAQALERPRCLHSAFWLSVHDCLQTGARKRPAAAVTEHVRSGIGGEVLRRAEVFFGQDFGPEIARRAAALRRARAGAWAQPREPVDGALAGSQVRRALAGSIQATRRSAGSRGAAALKVVRDDCGGGTGGSVSRFSRLRDHKAHADALTEGQPKGQLTTRPGERWANAQTAQAVLAVPERLVAKVAAVHRNEPHPGLQACRANEVAQGSAQPPLPL